MMPYPRYGGGPQDNRGGQPHNQPVSPWQGGFPAGNTGQGNNLSMNLLGTLMNTAASSNAGNMANLATSLVAQALQNKPGGMIIGGNHFAGPGSMGGGGGPPPQMGNSGPRGSGFMDRGGRDDYRRGSSRDHRATSSSRRPYRRSRSRSRDRGNRGSRRDDSSRRPNHPPQKRMRTGSPKDRAPFEIYIGNYPVRFREADVRNLFQEHGVTVSTIRLKHDGHKVFAFAETTSEDEIQKAIKAMDSKEIHGRRLRVRSSKDKDRKDKQSGNQAAEEKKKPAPKRELTEDDVTRHLVFAFNAFLDRQANKEGIEDDKKGKLQEAKDLLKAAFEIPDDDSLKISRNLELIFLQNNRREIPVPKVEEQPEEPAQEQQEEVHEEPQDDQEKEATEKEEEVAEQEVEEANNGEENQEEQVVKEEEEEEVEEKDEESELVEQLGDAIENLVEEDNNQEEEENNEEAKDEEQEEVSEEAEEPVKASPRGGRGRGGPRGRRSRGRRGA